MKKKISDIKTLAALLMAGATFTACSDKDEIIGEQPVNPATKYAMTVNATKANDGQTRALSLNNKTLNVKWAATDEVSVFPETWSTTAYGTLTAAASDNGSTKLTGDLTTAPAAGDNLKLLFPRATWDYTGQTGVLLSDANSIEKKFDYALADVEVNSVSGNSIATTDANFASQQAIVKFTLQNKSGNALDASNLTISAASGNLVTGKDANAPSYHSGYTHDGGTSASNGYTSDKLVDGNKTSTMWYTQNSNKVEGIWYCEFHTASAVRVEGYTLTTGHDNARYKNQNPKDWVLKAKVNSGDEWVTIATVTNDATLEDVNLKSYNFDVDTPGKYQYFRFEVSANHGSNYMQLEELQLFEKTYGSAYGDLTVTPSGSTASELTVALRNENASSDTYTITANVGGTMYGYQKSGVTFENGKYYAITLKMAPTIIWNNSNIGDINVYSTHISYTKEGIELKSNGTINQAQWSTGSSGSGIEFIALASGGFTFTAPTGKNFKKIEMTVTASYDWSHAASNNKLGTDWSFSYQTNKVTWTGNASTVDLLSDTDDFKGAGYVSSIVFTLSE